MKELLSAREAAILIVMLLEKRNAEPSPATRVRLSERTFRRMCGRERLSRKFLEEVEEWVWRGGWTLLYARTTFAAIKTSSVLNWARLSSRRMAEELEKVHGGTFDFEKYFYLLGDAQRADDGDQ